MPNFQIIPAHDEKVMCHFTVPRKGKPDLEFSVRRMEYVDPSVGKAYDDWYQERIAGADAAPVAGQPAYQPPSARELVLKQLEVAMPKQKYDQVEKLTTGELNQIFDAWMEESKTTPGESEASESSSEASSQEPSTPTS